MIAAVIASGIADTALRGYKRRAARLSEDVLRQPTQDYVVFSVAENGSSTKILKLFSMEDSERYVIKLSNTVCFYTEIYPKVLVYSARAGWYPDHRND